MSRYSPKMPPTDPGQLTPFLNAELHEIARSITEPDPFITLDTLYAAPSKLREGMIALADGVNWSPSGLGAGVFCYYGGTWNKLG